MSASFDQWWPRDAPLGVRFWAKVLLGDGADCWLWRAALTDNGYGRMTVNGRQLRAHRLAYELSVGPIPAGAEIDHQCFTPACVNPAHLRPLHPVSNRQRTRSKLRTHCARGHEFTPENTYWRKKFPGQRICRKCAALMKKARRNEVGD